MTSQPPRHLVAVWNPSYAQDALDDHLRILVDWNTRFREGKCEEDDVYVWWARLRSPNRLQPLPHVNEILQLNEQIDKDIETHVYLTDYRSLYVADLSAITTDDPVADRDAAHLPGYAHNKAADFYFMLDDIRRLVADDTVATVEELSKLMNVRYDRRPVSLYGGMTDLPLIVERPDPRLWFSDLGQLTDGMLWAEHDMNLRHETDRMSRELRENLFGDDVWRVLEHGTRTFLAVAEATFRAHRADPSYDFSGPAVEFAKAVETEVNALLFARIRKAFSKGNPVGRHTRVNDTEIDLGGNVPHQTLGSLLTLLKHNREVQGAVKVVFQNGADFILGELPAHLEPIAAVRNPAAHSARVEREACVKLREAIVGIGQEGLIPRLARAKMR